MAANPQRGQGRAQPIGFDDPLIEFDDASLDPWRIQSVRHHREAGVTPPPVGRHGWLDAATHAGIFAAAGMRRIATTLAGKPELSRRARFALVAQ